MSKLMCLEDFFVDSFGSKSVFTKGKIYNYKIDSIEWLCDEMALHMVNNIPLNPYTIRENFLLLEEYRDEQLNVIFFN